MHNDRMFEWSDLRHLIAVPRCGSTPAAAKELGVTPSTVHRRRAEIEGVAARRSKAPPGSVWWSASLPDAG